MLDRLVDDSLDFTGFKALLLPRMALGGSEDGGDEHKDADVKAEAEPPMRRNTVAEIHRDLNETIEHLRTR
jgi:hypothetical protein